VEEAENPHRRVVAPEPVPLAKVRAGTEQRRLTGLSEFDRVIGGGLVDGSAILLGGEPGVGKSTLLLQAAGQISASGGRSLICTGEESAVQVAMRAKRLGIDENQEILLLADGDVDRLIAAADEKRPDLLVVDSIQSIASRDVEGAPGGVSQVRESAARLIRFAKERGIAVALVGHVTKDGNLAGPKLLEHMVDVVLSFEGDMDHGLRALRCLKNRFGPTHVVALFDMSESGLAEVKDPSRAFLADWRGDVPGTVVFPSVEGRRSILVEVQALADSTRQVVPRRSFRGVDQNRVHQILAVLNRQGRFRINQTEIYLNVVGGWQLDEPASDLAIALAVASSVHQEPLGSTAAWGEIGLGGEVRPVPNDARRREEAARFGVERLIAPDPGSRLDVRSALLQSGLW
jgi:DNA repair protein RadA/Sms